MTKLTITKNRFLNWYYESGQDQENDDLKKELAESLIHSMRQVGFASISVQELFDNCNQESIRLNFTEEGCKNDYDTELSDLGEFEITLI